MAMGVWVRVGIVTIAALLAGPALADNHPVRNAQTQSARPDNSGMPQDATPAYGDDGSVINPDGDDDDATSPDDEGDYGDDQDDDGGDDDDGGLPATNPV
jgi:hypothetical protein